METSMHEVAAQGQSAWLDGISREELVRGDLFDLVGTGIRGLTMDAALLRGALVGLPDPGESAESAVLTENGENRRRAAELLRSSDDPKRAYLALAEIDARQACAILEAAVTDTGPRDGWVSLAVDPRHAHDARATVEEAYALHQAVDHPRFAVQIPGTVQGLAAVEEATALGVRIDVTMLFSVFRHRQAAEAYLRGLRRLRDSGGVLRGMCSFAGFAVAPIGDTAEGGPDLAIANAKIAYRTFKEVFTGMAWEELARAGAEPQWCRWAATAPQGSARTDLKYLEALIGPDTITTMPRPAAEAFAEHGRVRPALEDGLEEAGAVLDGLRRAGVDYDALTGRLEMSAIREAASAFSETLRELTTVQAGL